MTTQTHGYVQTQKPAFTLDRLLAAVFAVELREALAENTKGNKADAAYIWGL